MSVASWNPHISDPKFKIEPTSVSNSEHCCDMGSSTLFKIVNTLYRANDACFAIHFWLLFQLPFLNSVTPRYLNDSTTSNAVL